MSLDGFLTWKEIREAEENYLTTSLQSPSTLNRKYSSPGLSWQSSSAFASTPSEPSSSCAFTCVPENSKTTLNHREGELRTSLYDIVCLGDKRFEYSLFDDPRWNRETEEEFLLFSQPREKESWKVRHREVDHWQLRTFYHRLHKRLSIHRHDL